ncbi:MAG: hypothetical protein M1818_007178 [Claussenomyces sp. TS43310]|nr:MAG: hypothetical protein M1818_007178 [Claussenomyces sp. TS43310]
MTFNGSHTTTVGSRDGMSASQLLVSSISSLSSTSGSQHASSQISKIYRQASTLFLTRRLPESLSTLLPVVTPPITEQDLNGLDAVAEPAPIASASRTTRIKVWSLYLTILNAVVELNPEEGKQAFGIREWRSLVKKVKDGEVWEEVVQNGYDGIEGDVDSDVVINLATLLLAHAPTQALNQQRLENYLASSSQPNLDVSTHFQHTEEHGREKRPSQHRSKSNGTNTPRDLNARVKILELYTLHVLLRNNEWDYARDFISASEILDEERRDAFLQALQSLQDDQYEREAQEQEAQRQQEDQLQKDLDEARQRRLEEEERERQRQEQLHTPSKRPSSEVDYGIESTNPSLSAKGSSKARSARGVSKSTRSRGSVSNAAQPSVSDSKAVVAPTMVKKARAIIANIMKLMESMAESFRMKPMILLRVLAFIVALTLALGRKDIKDRLRRILDGGWKKLRATAGMGVKYLAATNHTLVLIVTKAALVAYTNQRCRTDIGVTDWTFAITFVAEATDSNARLLAAHNKIAGVCQQAEGAGLNAESFKTGKAGDLRMMARHGSQASAAVTPELESDQPISPRASKRRQSSPSDDSSKRPRLSADDNAESPATLRSSPNAPPPIRSAPPVKDQTTGRRKSTNQEERRRGQRLFGGLLSTLSQSTLDAQQKRRQEVERRQQERARIQKAEDESRREERMQKLKTVREREQVTYNEQSMRIRHSNMLAMAHFLRTKAQPPLYYKPWEMLPRETERIKAQIADAEAQIDREVQVFKKRYYTEISEEQQSGETDVSAERTAGEHQVEFTSVPAVDTAATNSTNPLVPVEALPSVSTTVPSERDPVDDTGEVVEEADEDTVIY